MDNTDETLNSFYNPGYREQDDINEDYPGSPILIPPAPRAQHMQRQMIQARPSYGQRPTALYHSEYRPEKTPPHIGGSRLAKAEPFEIEDDSPIMVESEPAYPMNRNNTDYPYESLPNNSTPFQSRSSTFSSNLPDREPFQPGYPSQNQTPMSQANYRRSVQNSGHPLDVNSSMNSTFFDADMTLTRGHFKCPSNDAGKFPPDLANKRSSSSMGMNSSSHLDPSANSSPFGQRGKDFPIANRRGTSNVHNGGPSNDSSWIGPLGPAKSLGHNHRVDLPDIGHEMETKSGMGQNERVSNRSLGKINEGVRRGMGQTGGMMGQSGGILGQSAGIIGQSGGMMGQSGGSEGYIGNGGRSISRMNLNRNQGFNPRDDEIQELNTSDGYISLKLVQLPRNNNASTSNQGNANFPPNQGNASFPPNQGNAHFSRNQNQRNSCGNDGRFSNKPGPSGFQNQGTSDYQNQGTSGYQNQGTSDYLNQGLIGFQNQRTSGYQNKGASGYQNQGTSGFQNQGTSGYQRQGQNNRYGNNGNLTSLLDPNNNEPASKRPRLVAHPKNLEEKSFGKKDEKNEKSEQMELKVMVTQVDLASIWYHNMKVAGLRSSYYLFQVVGRLESVRVKPLHKVIIIRHNTQNTALQCVFYEIDRKFPPIVVGSTIIVTGHMIGEKMMKIFDIEQIYESEIQKLHRLVFLCERQMKDVIESRTGKASKVF